MDTKTERTGHVAGQLGSEPTSAVQPTLLAPCPQVPMPPLVLGKPAYCRVYQRVE